MIFLTEIFFYKKKEMGRDIVPFHFDMTQVNAFRYRVQDGLRAVTGASIKEARLKDVKSEILNSDKLKVIFLFFSYTKITHSHC